MSVAAAYVLMLQPCRKQRRKSLRYKISSFLTIQLHSVEDSVISPILIGIILDICASEFRMLF